MIAFTDVHYRERDATAACVVVRDWHQDWADAEWTCDVAPIAPYQPGRFFLRELPCLLEVLRRAPPLNVIVIDGYVFLDDAGSPGLGAHLYDALAREVPVIGLAKTRFKGSSMARELPRPGTTRPLFLTCVGVTQEQALEHVSRLHGAHRWPTLLKRVDSLSRGLVQPT